MKGDSGEVTGDARETAALRLQGSYSDGHPLDDVHYLECKIIRILYSHHAEFPWSRVHEAGWSSSTTITKVFPYWNASRPRRATRSSSSTPPRSKKFSSTSGRLTSAKESPEMRTIKGVAEARNEPSDYADG